MLLACLQETVLSLDHHDFDEGDDKIEASSAAASSSSSSSSKKAKAKAKVAIFTYVMPETDTEKHFAVPDIMDFATYHAAIMSSFAEQNGYIYRLITPASPDGHPAKLEPADVRWNKVKLLIDALDPISGWAKDADFIAWLDADAIILDLGLRLEAVMEEQHPDADFLASADIRQGYINSGMLLLRNTEWTRTFLSRWWNLADRSTVCDQDAFDIVGMQQPTGQEIATKINILRRDALNTDPPATLKMLPHNQVLHLMGESTSYRTAVFQAAFKSICDSRTGGILPAQLGLHRKLLADLALKVYRKETQKEMEMMALSNAPNMFERIGRAAHHLCDLLQSTSQAEAGFEEAYLVRTQVFALVFQWLERVVGLLLAQQKADQADVTSALLQLLKRAAECGNDVFGAAQSVEQKRDAAEKTFRILDELHSRVDSRSQLVPAHMQALMHQNMAYMEFELGMSLTQSASEPEAEGESKTAAFSRRSEQVKQSKRDSCFDAAETHASKSVALFHDYFSLEYDRSIHGEHLQSLQVLAAIYCTDGRNFAKGTEMWKNAVNMAHQNMNNLRMGQQLDLYGSILHNAAVCHLHANQLEKALELSKEAMRAREEFSVQQGLPVEGENLQETNALLAISRDLYGSVSKHTRDHDSNSNSNSNLKSKQQQHEGEEKVYSMADFDEEEWEECEEGEEGCEAFIVSEGQDEGEYQHPDNDEAAIAASAAASNVDVTVGFEKLQGVKHTSVGLDDTLDNIDKFIQNLGTGASSGEGDSISSSSQAYPKVDIAAFDSSEWEECEEDEEGCEGFMVDEESYSDHSHSDNIGKISRSTGDTNEGVAGGSSSRGTDDDKKIAEMEELEEVRLLWAQQTAQFSN
eukprot:GSChrysophyteH2.ASY1.ANO1.111.1 assembled CDS